MILNGQSQQQHMQFRVRPSSKKSNNNDVSMVEFPTIRSINQLDSSISRPLAAKLSSLQSTLSTFQQLYRRDRQIDNASVVEVQKRLDKLQYKMFSTEQDIRQFSDIRDIKMARESYNYDSSGDTSKNQIAVLRQALLQERQAQKESLKHQNTLLEQLSLKQMRAQQQFRELISQQRMDYEYRLNDRGEQLKQFQDLKQRKVQQQYELMKGIISKAQRNIYQQLQRKIQNETIMKDYIENRLADLKEEMIKQHKQVVSTEAKFMRETKMSLESLFGFISGVKRELGEEILETQKLSVKSMQNLSNNFDGLHRKSKEDLKTTINSQNEVGNELVQLRNFLTTKLQQNRQFLSQFQSQIMDKLSMSGVRSNSDTQRSTIDSQRFSLFQKQINQWKSITQQKNLNVFKQISNTLKTIKQQWRKENDDLVSQVSNLNDSLNSIKKNGPLELKKNIQTLITIFNNQFDVLAEELQSMTELISLAKKENQKNVKQQINKNGLEMIETTKIMMNDRIRQANHYTDKSLLKNEQSFKSIMQKQIKYATQSINKHLLKNDEQLNSLQSTIKKNNLLTVSQLQDFSMKLKVFNDSYKNYLQQTRKQQLRKRNQLQQAMRKNANNLMDICYKKSELLVESLKKNIQTSQMKQRLQTTQAIQSSKDQFKKEIQVIRLQWQKQLTASMEKLTKERENSEEILHEAIEQSILNTKVALGNDIGNLRIELQQKISDMKVKQVQKSAEEQKEKQGLKKEIEKLFEVERKVFQNNLTTTQSNLDNKIKDQELEIKKQKMELEELIKKSIDDASSSIKKESEEINKKQSEKELQEKKKQQQSNKRITQMANQLQTIKKTLQQIKLSQSKTQQQASKPKQSEDKKVSQQNLNKLRLQFQQQIRNVKVLIEQLQARIQNSDQQQTIQGLKKNINKLQAMAFSEQAKNKAILDRINEDINKITDSITLITNQMSQ